MESFHLIRLAEILFRAIDGLFSRSLQRSIPDLHDLLEDPPKVLDHKEILVGPSRKYFSSTLVGFIWTFRVICLGATFITVLGRLGVANIRKEFTWGILGGLALAFFVLGFRSRRGGQCRINLDGVEFKYRDKIVRCSWEVFDAWGEGVILEEENILLVPINSQAADQIQEINPEEDTVKATGMKIKLPQWTTRSTTEAKVSPLYEVDIHDLCELLLTVGRKLGAIHRQGEASAARREGIPDSSRTPSKLREHRLATRDDNGWIRMDMTALFFPSFCCVCTRPTNDCHDFVCPNPGERHYEITVPTCKSCKLWFKLKKITFILCTFFVILGIEIGILIVWNPTIDQDGKIPPLAPIVCLAPFLGSWLMTFFFFRLPITVRYAPAKAVLRMRFRNPAYEEMVLAQVVPE